MDQAGVEPATSALPRRRATSCATGPCVGDPRLERGVSCTQGKRVHRLPRPRSVGSDRAREAPGLIRRRMPSTVEISTAQAPRRARTAGVAGVERWCSAPRNRNAALSGSGGRRGLRLSGPHGRHPCRLALTFAYPDRRTVGTAKSPHGVCRCGIDSCHNLTGRPPSHAVPTMSTPALSSVDSQRHVSASRSSIRPGRLECQPRFHGFCSGANGGRQT